jgi:hypothetical protein
VACQIRTSASIATFAHAWGRPGQYVHLVEAAGFPFSPFFFSKTGREGAASVTPAQESASFLPNASSRFHRHRDGGTFLATPVPPQLPAYLLSSLFLRRSGRRQRQLRYCALISDPDRGLSLSLSYTTQESKRGAKVGTGFFEPLLRQGQTNP